MSIDGLAADIPLSKAVLTLGVLTSLWVLRTFTNQALLRRVERPDLRRRWLVTSRNVAVLLGVAAVVAIWADALRPFAVSLLAVAVAVVIATKELIQSGLASLLRSATSLYSLGDRIEIGSYRGDVVDHNLFTTTIMEVGPGRAFHMRTGRTITFPNSKLLDTYLINESYSKDYVNHSFSIQLKAEQDWERAEEILLTAAREECSPFIEQARASMKHLAHAQALNGLAVNPRSAVQVADPGKLNLVIRFPAPVGRQGRIEQAILRRFLKEYYGKSNEASSPDGEAAKLPEEPVLAVLREPVEAADYVI